MALTPTMREILGALNAADSAPIEEAPLEESRALAREMVGLGSGEKQPVSRVEDTLVPGPGGDVPVRIYDPHPGETSPVVAYFHGGGFVFMDIESYDWTCRRLANAADAMVVSVDYRLAPEERFPAALDDCRAVTRWLAEHAREIGGDPSRLAVAGDSAGGNLAAATALASRREGGPEFAAQVLVYPVTDAGCDTGSYLDFADGYLLTASSMRWFWDCYLGPDGDPDHPYASVLRAPDLSGLAPAMIVTAECDPLRDEGEEYAKRLAAAGVEVTARRWDGMIHGFAAMYALIPEAETSTLEIAEFLRRHF